MSNALAIKDKVASVQKMLADRQTIIARSMPTHVLSPERFQQVILTACTMNPYLLDCKPASLIGSIIRGASLGLDPEPALGQMYLVPFKGVVQLIIGYKGLVGLAWQTGQLATVGARSVRDGDAFDYEYGSSEWLKHRPVDDSNKPFTHFYATVKMHGAQTAMFDVMDMAAIQTIKSRSPSVRAQRSSPWDSDFEAMAKKTVLRRLCKLVPASTEKARPLQQAIDQDERAEAGLRQHNDLLVGEVDDADEVDEAEIARMAAEAEQS